MVDYKIFQEKAKLLQFTVARIKKGI